MFCGAAWLIFVSQPSCGGTGCTRRTGPAGSWCRSPAIPRGPTSTATLDLPAGRLESWLTSICAPSAADSASSWASSAGRCAGRRRCCSPPTRSGPDGAGPAPRRVSRWLAFTRDPRVRAGSRAGPAPSSRTGAGCGGGGERKRQRARPRSATAARGRAQGAGPGRAPGGQQDHDAGVGRHHGEADQPHPAHRGQRQHHRDAATGWRPAPPTARRTPARSGSTRSPASSWAPPPARPGRARRRTGGAQQHPGGRPRRRSTARPMTMATSSRAGPMLGISQYRAARMNPAPNHQPRTAGLPRGGDARMSSRPGTSANQARNSRLGAGKASTGSAPATRRIPAWQGTPQRQAPFSRCPEVLRWPFHRPDHRPPPPESRHTGFCQ